MGATVLVSLVVIFVPMLLEKEPVLEQGINSSNVPAAPERLIDSRVLPPASEPLALPAERAPRIIPLQPPETRPDKPSAKPAPPPRPAVEPRVGVSAWMIQLGSFSNRDNADKLVERLRGKSFATDIEQVTIGGRTLYRVLVGPEVDRKRAESLLESVNKEVKDLKLQGKIRKYP